MAIVHVRIDYRLIHGQVATFWTNHLKTTRIMVVDDAAAKDDIKKAALKIATPSGVALSVLSVEKAAENINSGRYDGQRVMMILGSVATLQALLRRGVRLTACNVGNLAKGPGKIAVSPTVALTAEEADALQANGAQGIELTLQLIPSSSVSQLIPAIKKAFHS